MKDIRKYIIFKMQEQPKTKKVMEPNFTRPFIRPGKYAVTEKELYTSSALYSVEEVIVALRLMTEQSLVVKKSIRRKYDSLDFFSPSPNHFSLY